MKKLNKLKIEQDVFIKLQKAVLSNLLLGDKLEKVKIIYYF